MLAAGRGVPERNPRRPQAEQAGPLALSAFSFFLSAAAFTFAPAPSSAFLLTPHLARGSDLH